MRWRLLAIVVFVFGVMIPTALAVSNEWWGTANGDFRDTPQDNNYVIHPPVDQLPQSAPGGSSQDGARLSQIIHRPGGAGGTAAAYVPNQYFVSSTTPHVRFELRGGHWSEDNAGGQDRYDRDAANVDGIVDLVKKRGFLSPVYYEVYQLGSGGQHDGRLLGVINPRDRNIFPTTDNQPNSNTNCKYSNGASGPCWRTFEINAPGGPAGAITNRITLNGQQQDSCSKRYGQWPNGCYTSTKISKADTTTRLADEFDENTSLAVHDMFDTLQVGAVPAASGKKHKGIADNFRDFFLGEKALANHVGGTHQITVFVNPQAHSPGKVTVQIFGGACTDNVKTVGAGGSVTFGGCPNGHTYTAAVHQSQFDDGPFFPNPPGGPSVHCSIGDGAKTQAVGGDNQANFTYNCTRKILVWANPRGVTGGKVTAQVFGGACNDNQKVINSDGYALFAGCPLIGHSYNAVVHEDKFTKFDSGGVVYTCETDGNKNKNVGSDNQVNFFYHCDRHNPTANDGGTMSAANFNQVDPSDNARFNSPYYPNLNGNYVFLIKAVVFEDRFNGYVTHFNDIIRNNSWDNGCITAAGINVVRCPEIILKYAQSRNIKGPLIQNGYYIRAPKNTNGGKQFVASAPASIAFNINYGPVGGVANPPGEDREYEEMAGQSYRGLRFQAGGAGCRNDDWSHRGPFNSTTNALFKVGNADWDYGAYLPPLGGFEGGAPPGDGQIQAQVERLGILDENNNLNTSGFNPPNGITKQVINGSISGTWQSYPLWAIFLDSPSGTGDYNPLWRQNEQMTGRLDVHNWNDGNNLYQGGAPFTWGYWPTCLGDGTGGGNDFFVTPHTPKSVNSGYKYNGKDAFDQMGNSGEADLDFKFQYTLPETRGKVDYSVRVRLNGNTVSYALRDDQNIGPGTHQREVQFETRTFAPNTTYTWQACVNPGPTTKCTGEIPFQVNKGPVAEVVSGDPDYNTNTGNVNYNCSKLAVRLTDPEGHQVRPHFAISWVKDGQTNVVSSTNFGGSGNSDNWGRWVSGNGYRNSGNVFTSDEVRPVRWTVNGSSRSVPNKTLTAFLQQDVPEGVNVTWRASGEDRYGASEVGDSPTDIFYQLSNPRAVHDASPFNEADEQDSLGYRRFGDPVTRTFHKNTRPNLLPPGSTKKFFNLDGTETQNVIDGQLVRVETTLRNTGETPTKNYEIYDYIGAVRDFEPPITTSSELPVTVRYNNGEAQAVDPLISLVVPDHSDGNNDQCLGAAPCLPLNSSNARQASYKLDFGANPNLEDEEQQISIERNGDDYINCGNSCLNDPKYPHDVYWQSNPSQAEYRLNGANEGTYDLRLEYFNGLTNEPEENPYPPSNYSFNVRVDYPGGSKTVQLPIEANAQSRELHEFIVRDLNITSANPVIRITWDNNRFQLGQYDSNFGLNALRLTSVKEATLDIPGEDFANCLPGGRSDYCQTNDPKFQDAVYAYSGREESQGNPEAWMGYNVSSLQSGTYDLTLNYYNARGDDTNYPPSNYAYRVRVDYPGGSKTVDLPIEANAQSKTLHSVTVPDINISGSNPQVSVAWLNDRYCGYDGGCNDSRNYDANFGLESLRLAPEAPESDSILRPGQLNPGESITISYYIRADRNRTTTSSVDQNQNLQRRLQIGDETGPQTSQPDPKGGTIDIGDAHTFVPYSEDYCNRSNPLINHTCEFNPGDVLAPWLRGQRGSIASNENVSGYDPLPGEQNATFLVQANGALSHFSGGIGELSGYQAAPTTCTAGGDVDWRKEMYHNIQRLLEGNTHNLGASVAGVMNLEAGGQNVWYRNGNLRIRPTEFRGTGTLIVKGDVTIEGDLRYSSSNSEIDSLGLIVLGNVNVEPSVGQMVGTYYVSDIRHDLGGTTGGCPFTNSTHGIFTTGRSATQLNVQGVLVARQFNFQRYFIDPSDSVADPAEDVYYDGRVVANTPPGFSTFRNTAAWYEVIP